MHHQSVSYSTFLTLILLIFSDARPPLPSRPSLIAPFISPHQAHYTYTSVPLSALSLSYPSDSKCTSLYVTSFNSGRGDQSKGGRGAHGFGNEGQEALEAQKDPASANPVVEGQEEVAPEPVVEAEPEPGKFKERSYWKNHFYGLFFCSADPIVKLGHLKDLAVRTLQQ